MYKLLLVLLSLAGIAKGQLTISEFLASNSNSIQDEDSSHEDWIEIRNDSGGTVNLAGWYLSDDSTQPREWALPNWTLNAGNYVVVFASGKNRRPPQAAPGQDNAGTNASPRLHTNFKLSTSGEYLALSKDGAEGALEIKQSFNPYPQQLVDVAYGTQVNTTVSPLLAPGAALKYLVPSTTNGGSTLAYTAWTGAAASEPFAETGWSAGTTIIGFTNSGTTVPQTNLKVRLNANAVETLTTDTSSGLHDATNTGVTFSASDTDGLGKTRHGTMVFNATDSNNSITGDLAVVPANTDLDSTTGTIAFWIRTSGLAGAGNDGIVYDRRAGLGVGVGTVIFQGADGKLQMQAGGGAGVAAQFATATSIADDRWHHVALLYTQAVGGICYFYVDGALSSQLTVATAWSWSTTQALEIGHSHDPYWRPLNGQLDDFRHYTTQLSASQINTIATNADEPFTASTSTAGAMLGNPGKPSIFLRIPFQVDNPAAFDAVRLTMKWADGYSAWINGNPVGSFAAPTPLAYNSTATQTHSFGAPYFTAIGSSALRSGTNILAIQGMNDQGVSQHFGILPEVSGVNTVQGVAGYLVSPTPGAANSAARTTIGPFVTEVTKNPARPTGTGTSPALTINADVLPTLRPLKAGNPVQLKYCVMFNAEQSVDMTDQGPVANAPAGTRRFSATIATNTLGAGQMLRWRVAASDNTDVQATAPAYIDPLDNEQYYGTVAVDSSIESNLPVLYWFTPNGTAAESETGVRNAFFFRAIGDTGPGRFYDNVEINIHGQSTRGFPKKSYDLDFNEDNRFEWDVTQKRVKDINLLANWGDKSKTHNVMTHEAFAAAGSVAHWGRQVRVQQVTPGNAGTPATHFFSISDMLENGNDDFIERNGRDPNGSLYKVYDNLTSTAQAEKKTRKTESKAEYQALIDGLDPNATLANRRLYAYDNMDLPQCVSYFVGCIITSHQDHGHKNYYLYRDTLGSGDWSILPWDVDLTWGRTYLDNPGYFSDVMYVDNELDQYKASMQNKGENRLYNLFVGNSDIAGRTPAPEFRDMVLRRLRTVMDTYFSAPNVLENRFAQLADLMDPPAIGTSDADRDFSKYGTWQTAGGATGGAAMRYHISEITGPGRYLAGRRAFLNTATLAGASVPASQTASAVNQVTIETVDFKPATSQEQEYFVVRNSGALPVDISGWQITGAVNMVFRPGTVLPPGGGATENLGDLYVAKNPAAFRARATVSDDGQAAKGKYRFVEGPYSGQLSARGETIELRDAAGTLLKTKTWVPDPTPTQTQLRVTEINFAPTSPSPGESADLSGVTAGDFEFIELQNIGATPLTITGAYFTAGVSFTFPARTLAAGERVLVVANAAAFQRRYGHGKDALIAGAFLGSLDNSGENLQLTDVIGETILDFTYSGAWFPPSNTGGRSLVVRSATPAYDSYDLAQSWLLSGAVNGSPGSADTDFATVFEGWRYSYFAEAEFNTLGGPLLDPDGDGLNNFTEYAFARLPKTADSGTPLATAGTTLDGGSEYLTVTFRRPHQALDLTYSVEACDDLTVGNWQPVGVLVAPAVDLGNNVEEVTYRDNVPHTTTPRFMRVRCQK
jgi:hypothetical protein